jgi:hypothetical protein
MRFTKGKQTVYTVDYLMDDGSKVLIEGIVVEPPVEPDPREPTVIITDVLVVDQKNNPQKGLYPVSVSLAKELIYQEWVKEAL